MCERKRDRLPTTKTEFKCGMQTKYGYTLTFSQFAMTCF